MFIKNQSGLRLHRHQQSGSINEIITALFKLPFLWATCGPLEGKEATCMERIYSLRTVHFLIHVLWALCSPGQWGLGLKMDLG